MAGYQVNITCPKCGTNSITLPPDYTYEMAKDWCGIYDGSSSMYVAGNPRDDPNSLIGKCATCGRQVNCSIAEN